MRKPSKEFDDGGGDETNVCVEIMKVNGLEY